MFRNDWNQMARHLGQTFDLQLMHSWPEFDRLEEGGSTIDDFHRTFQNVFNLKIGKKKFRSAFASITTETFEGVESRLLELSKSGFPIFALSNTNAVHLAHLRKRFRVMTAFQKIFASYRFRIRKPSLPIYQRVLTEIQLRYPCIKPSEMLYVDDRPENLPPAEKLGIRVENVNSKQDLLRILTRNLPESLQ